MNKIYLYLKGNEELGDIIERIRSVREKEIILVVPENTKALLHPVNLEILKKEIDQLDKKVYLDTIDEKLINLAKAHRLNIFLYEFKEKKIVDIRPPQKTSIPVKEKIISEPTPKPSFKFKINLSKILTYLFSLIFIFFLGIFIWQVFQTRAEITLEINKINFEPGPLVITLKSEILKPDYENKILPAQYEKIELYHTETVTTTGKVFEEEKPLLKVVFLNFLEREIPLVSGTRVSYQGNVFRTTERIVIPPSQNNEPGKTIVTAFPDEIKDEKLFLLKNTDLIIPALEGKKNEEGKLWSEVLKAKVEEDYRFSSKTKIGSVAPEDLTKVKLALENSLKSAVKTELSFKYPQSFYYFDPSLVKVEIQSISHRVGEKTDKILASGKASFETLVTSQKEFDEFIRNLINQEILKQNKNLLIKNLTYEKIELLDFESKKKTMTLGISLKADLIPDLNPEAIKEKIKGKTLDFVKDYFAQIPEIKSVKIKIFPQWRENLPQDLRRIKITIE